MWRFKTLLYFHDFLLEWDVIIVAFCVCVYGWIISFTELSDCGDGKVIQILGLV